MPREELLRAVRQIRRLLDPLPGEGVPDAQLLERFARRREEHAFEALMDRHGPLVLGLCRRVLRHRQDAEDAFQATFLVLARRAGSIRNHESVGSWLYGVALRIASRAKQAAAKRRAREQPADDGTEPAGNTVEGPPEAAERRELGGLLDEEVRRLPVKYRVPVVLCCLQGRSNEEAVRELGWPVGTVKGRLSRARECLRRQLERRGVTLGIGALAAAQAAPPELAGGTLKAAVLFAEGLPPSAGASANAVDLAQGVLRTMLFAKLKTTAALLLVAVGIAGGSGAVTYRMAVPPEQARAAPPAADDAGWRPAVKLASPVDGMVRVVSVRPGAKVRMGERLLMLDGQLAETEVKIRSARVTAAVADLRVAVATEELRGLQYSRLKSEDQKGIGVDSEAFQAGRVALEQSRADRADKEKNLEIASAELERARVMREMYTIRSSLDGTVEAVLKQPGEAVQRFETVLVIRPAREAD